MTIDMSQFFQVFFDETEELLAEMEKLLLEVDVSAPDPEGLNAIFRAAHSIKGGAATFGITDLTEVTHVLETLLDRIRKGEMALTSEHVDAFLAAKDVLKMQLDGHRLHTDVDLDAVADIRMTLEALAAQDGAPLPSATPSALHSAAGAARSDRRFRIELPMVSARDVDALAAELGLLGDIARGSLDDQRAVFTLTTHEGQDDIIAICSFILDPKDLNITEEALPANDGIHQSIDERNKAEEQQGYGFFEPMHTQIADGSLEKQRENAQGYGFFAPFVPLTIPVPHPNANAEDEDNDGAAPAPQSKSG
ncbi:MAG TPA: Hpt domain-containing protein, partial [Oxalicibacterium sp.]|nr:Hpt domain-containing protein [Oxalicibacterium sp.]